MNQLITPTDLAKELIEKIDAVCEDLSEQEKRLFVARLINWISKMNGFPSTEADV